ncbi:hypothetical protein BCR43DRAFT_496898 [Syncephalastrum racemosum]|uniref:Tc1-like transposase DDE domain-containing protein n=1 Tax=Syncephalastrum racemosum TaxID=13706 RepID=A0A1X2H628_SYNRA|nr:hypothetical protein BCR43DRAFT_496898 [Syncephalastrum racemosum]
MIRKRADRNSRVANKKPSRRIGARRDVGFCKKSIGAGPSRTGTKPCGPDQASSGKGKKSGQIHVWRTKDEANLPDCLGHTLKSNRSSVMSWGGIIFDRKMELDIVKKDSHKRGALWRILLTRSMRNRWCMRFGICPDLILILMEDGAPIHRSNAPKQWLQEHVIIKIDRPAQSPDLDPIENL